MKTMTFTNTISPTGEVVSELVIVPSEALGKDLIAYWNRQATMFPPKVTAPAPAFHYAFVSCRPVTEEDYFHLGTFESPTNYYPPEKLTANR